MGLMRSCTERASRRQWLARLEQSPHVDGGQLDHRQCNDIAQLDYRRVTSAPPFPTAHGIRARHPSFPPVALPPGYSAAQYHAGDGGKTARQRERFVEVRFQTACFSASSSSLSLLCCMESILVIT
jgi:hypothetical protein